MNNTVKEMFDIAKRYNQALTLKSKRQISSEVEKLHSEMAPIYMKVTAENGYSEALCALSMELLHDIRWGRPTTVNEKLMSLT
ncbi:hypothetical protein AA28_21595 [Salmonella enterica]|nr:hypothetical protein [Salmonella enterica]